MRRLRSGRETDMLLPRVSGNPGNFHGRRQSFGYGYGPLLSALLLMSVVSLLVWARFAFSSIADAGASKHAQRLLEEVDDLPVDVGARFKEDAAKRLKLQGVSAGQQRALGLHTASAGQQRDLTADAGLQREAQGNEQQDEQVQQQPVEPVLQQQQHVVDESIVHQQQQEQVVHEPSVHHHQQQQVVDEQVAQQQQQPAEGLYALVVPDLHGAPVPLSRYVGSVSLVVNVASRCGYTDSNYRGLQELQSKYNARGFQVLAFPSNDFGEQEPGLAQEIESFARDQYSATFPLFRKVVVNGEGASPVFALLKEELAARVQGGGDPLSWNFNKFLIDERGHPVKRYGPAFDRQQLEADIEILLQPVVPALPGGGLV